MEASKLLRFGVLLAVCAAIATHEKEGCNRFEWEKELGQRGSEPGRPIECRSDVVSDAFGGVTEVIGERLAESDADRDGMGNEMELWIRPGGRGGSLWCGLPLGYKTGNDASIAQNKGDRS